MRAIEQHQLRDLVSSSSSNGDTKDVMKEGIHRFIVTTGINDNVNNIESLTIHVQ